MDASVALLGTGSFLHSDRTDGDGRFSVADLATGTGQVVARADGWAPLVASVPMAPGVHAVSLPEGATLGGVLVVRGLDGPGRIELHLESDAAYVLDPVLSERLRTSDLDALVADPLRAFTAPEGGFSFRGLAATWAGELALPETLRFAGDPADARRGRPNVLRFERPQSDLLLEVLAVSGIRGRVLDLPGGQPVARAAVQPRIAYDAEDRRNPTAQRSVLADEGGRFRVPVLGATIAAGKLTLWSPEGGTSREVLLEPQEVHGDLDLGDIPLHETTGACRLELLVQDEHAAPIEGAVAVLAGATRRSAPTDAGGRTALRGLVPAESVVCVGAVGFSSAEFAVPAQPPGEMVVTLERACLLEVHLLTPGGEPAKGVRVLLSATEPLFDADPSGMLAALYAGASPALSETIGSETRVESNGREGRVLFNSIRPRLAIHLEAYSRFGGRLAERDIPPLASGEHRVVEVTAEARRFCGRVVDERGQPLTGARVSISHHSLMPFRSGRRSIGTDERGGFVIEGLGADAVVLDVSKDGYAPDRFTCAVPADCNPIDLAILRSERRVLVRIRDAEGRPVDALVWAELDSGIRVYGQTVGAGELSLEDLPSGVLTVRATAYEQEYERVHDTLVPELEITLPPSGEVEVEATAPSESGGFVFVHLVPDDRASPMRSAQLMAPAGTTTRLAFAGVQPGRYDAVIRRLEVLSWDGEYDWIELSPHVALEVQPGHRAFAALRAD